MACSVSPKALQTWQHLNERQKAYLEAVYPANLEDLLFLRLTNAGRKLARTGLGESTPEKLPSGTLREWRWRALAMAYAAGEAGLRDEGAGHYAGVSWKTWRRLETYSHAGFGPLVKERQAGPEEYRMYITPESMRHYRKTRSDYGERYSTAGSAPVG
jgi:hypothetical protein